MHRLLDFFVWVAVIAATIGAPNDTTLSDRHGLRGESAQGN
jgi:hypothetical protein